MKKLLAVAVVSVAAVGLSAGPASAWCSCFHYKYCASAAQYNAFSPFCLSTVYGGKCGHCKCFHVADVPCCNAPPAPCCGPVCGDGCCAGPYCGDGGVIGQLPPAGGAPAQGGNGGQTFQPPMPSPLPGNPGPSSMMMPQRMPYGQVQAAGYRPMMYPGYGYGYQPMPVPSGYYGPQAPMAVSPAPAYWNVGN